MASKKGSLGTMALEASGLLTSILLLNDDDFEPEVSDPLWLESGLLLVATKKDTSAAKQHYVIWNNPAHFGEAGFFVFLGFLKVCYAKRWN